MRRRSDSVLSGLMCSTAFMLFTVMSLVLLQNATIELTLEVGEQRTVVVPGLQRLVMGSGPVDCKTIGNHQVLFIGMGEGKSSAFAWTGKGERVAFHLTVVPVKPKGPTNVPVTTQRKGDVTVFEFNEELAEITETREVDGGILIRGKNRKGLGVEVMLTPKN